MPVWQPDWNDVEFDFAGAEAAIAECRRARECLQTRDAVLAAPLARAREQWRGAKRVTFDETERSLAREIAGLIEELRAVEQGLYADMARASNEQATRVRARAQWHNELREEQVMERRRLEVEAQEKAVAHAKTSTQSKAA